MFDGKNIMKFQGRPKLVQYLKDNNDVAEEINKCLLKILNEVK